MKINIIPMGKSKGIRIPKIVLDQCRIKRVIDLQVQGNQIIIKSVNNPPRQGWARDFKRMHQRGEDKLLLDENYGK